LTSPDGQIYPLQPKLKLNKISWVHGVHWAQNCYYIKKIVDKVAGADTSAPLKGAASTTSKTRGGGGGGSGKGTYRYWNQLAIPSPKSEWKVRFNF